MIDAAYSEFTLNLLEDSGWYKVDHDGGCSFINEGCKSLSRREFCTADQTRMCSFNYKHKGYCEISQMANNCGFPSIYYNSSCEDSKNKPTNNRWGETFGTQSKCIMSTIIEKRYVALLNEYTMCYKYRCTPEGTIVFLPNGGGEIVCSKYKQFATVQGNSIYKGGIRCPDPADFCKDYYPSCPNMCSGKGFCFKGQCECRPG